MKYLLIKLEYNWADEFDVTCLWITTEDIFEEWKEQLNKCNINEDVDIYFGTNEWITFDSLYGILNSLVVAQISEEFYYTFNKLIGDEFGLISLKYLPDQYEQLDEDE